MSLGSGAFHAALHLPAGALPEAIFRSSGGLPGWVLLDSRAYMVNVCNETSAGNTTHEGLHIQVSFLVAEPPRLSYCCFCCTNREENPFAYVPRIVASVEDLALIEADLTTGERHRFVYAARGGSPSLHLLPDFRRYCQKEHIVVEAYGLMSYDEGRQFVVAAMSYMEGEHTLHVFRSRDSNWTKGLLQVDYGLTKKAKFMEATHVIALQDGLLGWVDLWVGILICDVSAFALGSGSMAPKSRFIPMPKPLPTNQEPYLRHDFSRPIRNVTFDRGHFKFVELEQLVRLIPRAAPVVYDPSDMAELYDSESSEVSDLEEEGDLYEDLGWRLVSWYRELSSDHWRRGTIVHSDDLGPVSLPRLGGGGMCAVNLSFKDLQTRYPILRGDDDVVHLISISDDFDQTAWIVAVDTKIKSLSSKPVPFSADISFLFDPTHIPCVLTKYIDARSDDPPRNCNVSGKKRQRTSIVD